MFNRALFAMLQQKRHLILWLTTMVLVGCALSPDTAKDADTSQTSVNNIGLTTEALTEELVALRESNKRLERLSELEGDLMLLLEELAKQPKIEERPEGYRTNESSEVIEPNEAFIAVEANEPLAVIKNPDLPDDQQGSPQTPNTNGNKPSRGYSPYASPGGSGSGPPIASRPTATYNSSNYILWLGFFVSEKAADAGSMRLQNKINFQRMGLNIEVVGNANIRGQYYGLVLGPFKTLQQANSFCSALAKHGQYCQVRPNSR